ncbi:hypothetical protein HDV62DRAFT_354170 [Trichoderma sp. SZMC 28011]
MRRMSGFTFYVLFANAWSTSWALDNGIVMLAERSSLPLRGLLVVIMVHTKYMKCFTCLDSAAVLSQTCKTLLPPSSPQAISSSASRIGLVLYAIFRSS